MTEDERVQALANCVVQYFLYDDRDAFEARSYQIAEDYLTERVAQRWNSVIQAD